MTLDEATFGELTASHRRRLHLHCYRMVGSFDEAEDLVQETLLRAWRGRASFQGRAALGTWLYRIATNVCLNALERSPRGLLPPDVVPPVTESTDATNAPSEPPLRLDLPWLQPYPDALLDLASGAEREPGEEAVSRETIELAYLAALQHLPARQRAVLILRDVLGWSANEVAEMLELTVAAANSALQRARATLRSQLPASREAWPSAVARTEAEDAVLSRFMQAWERADAGLLTSMLRDDARFAMPPAALWFLGQRAISRLFTMFPIDSNGEFRARPTRANRQPAAVVYLRPIGANAFNFAGIHVLRLDQEGRIAEITAFGPPLCRAFNLPPALELAD